MAENVTGQIGSDQVTLENAATEATLKLLLQATLATTKEQRRAISEIAEKANIDPKTIKKVNEGLTTVGVESSKFGAALGGLTSAFKITTSITDGLTSGLGSASDVLGRIGGLNGVVGDIASGLQRLAKFQEESMRSYQQLTESGVNFGGSLTNLRMAASNSYLTLDQFTNLMKTNSDAFSKLGGGVNSGAEAFAKMSKSLISSEAGTRLLALGMTAEEVNQNMANYITISGYRNKRDAETQAKMTQASAEYMEQLTGLAEITGKSRKEQQDELAQASKNAAWQSQLAMMDEKQRAKAMAGMANALALGGKGAVDLFQSKIMGIAPDKAGAMLMATASNLAGVIDQSADMVNDGTKGTADMQKTVSQGMRAAQQDFAKYGKEGLYAIIRQGGPTADALQAIGITANRAASMSEEEINKALEKAKVDGTQAEAAAKTQKAIQELGQIIMEKLVTPITDFLMPVMNGLIVGFTEVVKGISKIPGAFEAIVIGAGALIAVYAAQKAAMVAGAVKGGAGKVLEAVTGGSKAGGSEVGGALGGGLKGIGSGIKGLGMSLASLGPQAPMIALGAAAVGAAIVLIGAGIAGAAWLMGKALPTLAEGIASFAQIDGAALISVGAGVASLGAGLAVFGAGGVMGSVGTVVSGLVDSLGGLIGVKSPVEKLKEFATLGPGLEQAGNGIQAFTTNMNLLLSTDLSKISKLTAELQRLKEASTPAEKGILATASDLVKTAITSTASPTEGGGGGGGAVPGDMSEILTRELKALNKQTETLVKAMREAADSTAKTASLIASNGNLFRA
jgi:hypothetical protein